mmetsp:Transcript_37664/g.97401  ORF Transcript_37664/g.97401 Transcript_37664/m.97401 type:complete len:401 (+) Transcript_37664:71-1273(+)
MASPTPAGKKAGGLSWPSKPEDLAFVKRLGRGYFGEVWQCRLVGSQADAAPIAVKKVPLAMIQQHSLMEQMDREIAILRSLRHQHIVELFFDFRDNSHVYLGMEFAEGGGMFDLLSRTGTFSNELAAQYFYEVCDALRYLHNLPEKVIHRDIKPENVMFTDNQKKQVKIIDFGFAKAWDGETPMSRSCGTDGYRAPEVMTGSYTDKADLWSLGVLAHVLLTAELIGRNTNWSPRFSEHFGTLSPEAQSFIKSLLHVNPSRRPSAAQLLHHPWIMMHKADTSTLASFGMESTEGTDLAKNSSRKSTSTSKSSGSNGLAPCASTSPKQACQRKPNSWWPKGAKLLKAPLKLPRAFRAAFMPAKKHSRVAVFNELNLSPVVVQRSRSSDSGKRQGHAACGFAA